MVGSASGPVVRLRHFSGLHGFGSHFQINTGPGRFRAAYLRVSSGSGTNFGTREDLYLGVNISEDITWTTHIQTQVKKARQRLYHLRQLRKFRVSPAILKTFRKPSASQCGIIMPQTRTAKLYRESCV